MAFLTEAEWNAGEEYNGLKTILKWGEVPEKKIFLVILIEKKENLRYHMHVIHFMDAQEEGHQAFCPSHFLKQIRKNCGKNQRPHFISHGMIQGGENTMASFELLYKAENKSFDIFE